MFRIDTCTSRSASPRARHVLFRSALAILPFLMLGCGEARTPTGIEAPDPLPAVEVATDNGQVAALAEYVHTLVSEGRLRQGPSNALLAQLSRVGAELGAGNEKRAAVLLGALRRVLDSFVTSGQLSESDAAPLVNSVEGLATPGIALASIAAGERHACGLTGDGAAHCWGANESGQLGDGTNTTSSVPVAVGGGITFASLHAAGSFTCGLTPAGAAHCWGQNVGAQLGNGTTTDSNVPTPVAGGLTFTALATGVDHACGLVGGGEAHCWGGAAIRVISSGDDIGRGFGLGFTPTEPCTGRRAAFEYLCATAPAPVPTALRFAAIGAGAWSTCAISSDGDPYCWGWNQAFCALGRGEPCDVATSTPVPGKVVGGSGFASLHTGVAGSCGLGSSGEALCWGFGQIAGSTDFGVSTATPLPGGVRFATVDLSDEDFIFTHACGVDTGGGAFCWGAGGNRQGEELFGNLGDGSIPQETCAFDAPCTTIPSPVFGGITFSQVAAGRGFSCGVATTGEAYCWGVNDEGQLGTGGLEGAATPVRVREPV